MEIRDKILQICEKYGIRQADIVKNTKLSKANAYRFFTGEREINIRNLESVMEYLRLVLIQADLNGGWSVNKKGSYNIEDLLNEISQVNADNPGKEIILKKL